MRNMCNLSHKYAFKQKKKKIKCHIISAEIISNNEAEYDWAERKR